MKKSYIISITLCVIFILSVFSSCGKGGDVTEKKFTNTSHYQDIMDLEGSLQDSSLDEKSKLSLEKKMGGLYQTINNDDSDGENRVIGSIESRDVTAKELELRALYLRVNGTEKPYYDAWYAIKTNIAEENFAKKNGLYDKAVQGAKSELTMLKESFDSDSDIKKVYQHQMEVYGMNEDEYWKFSQDSGQRIMIHMIVTQYINEKGLDELDMDKLDCEITDSEYESLIEE